MHTCSTAIAPQKTESGRNPNKVWKAVRRMGFLSAMLTLPVVASATPFTNGSFELGGPANGGFGFFTSATSATGWTATGNLAGPAIFFDGVSGFNGTAKDGVAVIGFGGNGTTGATLSQTFDTVAGGSYTVNFFVEAQQLGSGPQAYRLEAMNGATGLNFLTGPIPDSPQAWVAHSMAFTALSTSSTIRFIDVSNGAAALGINWALDAVTVTGVTAPGPVPVPVPSALALLALGLAGVAFSRRRTV